MNDLKILDGKKVLIVDDEPDVLETLNDLLDMCIVDSSRYFKDAKELIYKNTYDIAIFDIKNVRGYDLLDVANQKNIPSLMFTAHALSPDDFVKSITGGAKAYVPKEKMSDITTYLADLIKDQQEGRDKNKWFSSLKSYFDQQFGHNWREQNKQWLGNYGWFMWDD